MRAELTIVIPAKNEANMLPNLLRSLCKQDYEEMGVIRVIVADAGSTDDVQDERAILQSAIDRSMGQATYGQVRQEFEQRVMRGEFCAIVSGDGRAAPQYTTAEMMRMEREIVGHMLRGNQRGYDDPMLVSPQLRTWTEDRHPELSRAHRHAVDDIFVTREKIIGLDGIAGAGKTTTLAVVREGAEAQDTRSKVCADIAGGA
jgi:glycosyltransferase involved in cell wall biosynthesis